MNNLLTMSLYSGFFGAGMKPENDTELAENVRAAFKSAGLELLRKKMAAHDFKLHTADGKEASLSSYKGSVVFLNFWATWCPGCRGEMPSMEALYKEKRESGLVMLAVDIEEKKEEVVPFAVQNNLSFPILMDEKGEVGVKYGVQSIPSTFIIDREGSIICRTVGGRDWHTRKMSEAFGLL